MQNLVMTRPHDLLWVRSMGDLEISQPLPDWVQSNWQACAPVVVRREQLNDIGRIPVGVRGKGRSERFSAVVRRSAVARRVSPEQLVPSEAWNKESMGSPGQPAAWFNELRSFPAVQALLRVAPLLCATGLTWGPAGSVGFALASGLPVLHCGSDLDLVVRAPSPLTRKQMYLLQMVQFLLCHCRIDMQIDTGRGGFAFMEWIRISDSPKTVLLKTDNGPFMTSDPWGDITGRSV